MKENMICVCLYCDTTDMFTSVNLKGGAANE